MTQSPDPSDLPTLSLSSEQLCFLVVKAREFDVKEEDSDPDSGSNPIDDNMVDVLESGPDDPVQEELVRFISAMSFDQQVDLVAMAWLGRGDGDLEDWAQLRAEAEAAHNQRTARYLLGMPLLSDYLEEAMEAFDLSCEEVERSRL